MRRQEYRENRALPFPSPDLGSHGPCELYRRRRRLKVQGVQRSHGDERGKRVQRVRDFNGRDPGLNQPNEQLLERALTWNRLRTIDAVLLEQEQAGDGR